MTGTIELPVPVDALVKSIDQLMLERGYVPKETLIDRTINIKEFSKKYCCNKASEWIRTFIFDEYPEVDLKNGGWVLNPRKTVGGKGTYIFIDQGKEWMAKHFKEIDWNQKLPS